MDIVQHTIWDFDIKFDVTNKVPRAIYGAEGISIASSSNSERARKKFVNNLFSNLRLLIHEGDIAIDCGAQYGFLTVLMAKGVGNAGSVVAIEPELDAYEVLQNNIKINNLTNVHSLRIALGDEIGMASMLGAKVVKDGGNWEVEQATIDSLNLKPNVMKIDVEASEVKLIRGALGTIEKYRPLMEIELHFFKSLHVKHLGDTPQMLLEMLFDNNYIASYCKTVIDTVTFFSEDVEYPGALYAFPCEAWDAYSHLFS